MKFRMEHRSSGWLWAAAGALVLLSAGVFVVTPYRSCADCEGSGIELVGAIGEQRGACERCVGKGRLSLLRKWTTSPKMTYVGAVDMRDYSRFVVPALAKERIPIVGGESSLGILGFYTDSPPNAIRARKVLEQDARLKGYRFPF